jgi:hypothetical protein
MALTILPFYRQGSLGVQDGILAPAAWLGMAFAAGQLGGAIRQVTHIGQGAAMSKLVSVIAAATAVLILFMILVCGRPWQREYLGLGKSLSTFAVSFAVVAVY